MCKKKIAEKFAGVKRFEQYIYIYIRGEREADERIVMRSKARSVNNNCSAAQVRTATRRRPVWQFAEKLALYCIGGQLLARERDEVRTRTRFGEAMEADVRLKRLICARGAHPTPFSTPLCCYCGGCLTI